MKKATRQTIAVGVGTFIVGVVFSYAAVAVPPAWRADRLEEEYNARQMRLAACLDAIVAEFNSRDTTFDLSTIDHHYDPGRSLCLYKGNIVGDIEGGSYFEKFLTNAVTGARIATYAELNGVPASTTYDGRPVAHTLESFNAAVDELFGGEQGTRN